MLRQESDFLLAFIVKAKLSNAFFIFIAYISLNLIALAHHFMRAIPLTAATSGIPAVAVHRTLFIALEEMRALLLAAAPREALEVIVAVVIVKLGTLQADGGVDAGIGGTTECGLNAIVVTLTEKDVCGGLLSVARL